MQHVSIFALGGLGEIGKNMYCVAYGDEIIVIDCGLKFPEEDMPGVDLIVPDVEYLIRNQDKVKGIFLTHGHEDHIGALPYILRKLRVPVYGAALTNGLVKAKLQEQGLLADVTMHEIRAESVVAFDKLSVSFFRTNHSIPDTLGVVVETPEGPVVHTGDFKFDLTPVGNPSDFGVMAALGQRQVLALLSDSTNSERAGYTPSEQTVGDSMDKLFLGAAGRVLFATFASNVYRLQQVVETSLKHGRKVVLLGRSMDKVFQIGQELGYIQAPEGLIISPEEARRLPPEQVTIICTGSQGEAMAALPRIARGSHRAVEIIPGDTVIFSSSPIPGNTKNVYRTIDQLVRLGADVKYGSVLDIHASGHGSQEDLKLMISLIRPKYFIPIHGEYRMLVQHTELATACGVPAENSFVLDNGDVMQLTRTEARKSGKVPAGAVLVDGSGVGDVGTIVLRDRRLLSAGGLVVVVMTVDMKNFKLLTGPDIVSRGFVYMRESEALIKEAEQSVQALINRLLEDKVTSWSKLKSQVTDLLSQYFYKKTGRAPMILPIIMEVNR